MASISTDKKGRRRILFSIGKRKRRAIRLGKVSMKTAENVKLRVEHLVTAALYKQAPDPETAAWVGDRDDKIYAKLAAVGLVPQREPAPDAEPKNITLGNWIDRYISGRTDVTWRTRNNLGQAQHWLVEYFGAEKRLVEISPGDADEWRRWLLERLGENTVRRHCGRAKQIFRAAVRKRLIPESPFADMKGCEVQADPERFYFVAREEAQQVLEACPDAEWRLIFALCRFGGLRCPSEVLELRWEHIDWEHGRMTVLSPKTKRAGKASRVAPIFAELRPYLEEAWEKAEPGAEHVISRYRDRNVNLRTQLERIITRAGLVAWDKPFQNLRSTRETELSQTFPLHVVCAWIGNTARIASKHYLQVTDADFQRAAGGGAQSGAREAQKAAQPASALSRQPGIESPQAQVGMNVRRDAASGGGPLRSYSVPPTRVELVFSG